MKNKLENILHQTKRFLATSLTTLALYAPAQDAVKLDVKSDGNWMGNPKATLYFQSTTGAQGRDLTKNKANQFTTPVYFYGRKTPEGEIEFAYMTVDLDKPVLDAPTLNNTNTKLYFFGDADTTAEIVSQRIAIMNSKGEVNFEETVPKEQASSLLMKLGDKIMEKLETVDRTSEYVSEATGGLLSFGITDALKYYCEDQTVSTGRKAKEKIGYELAINQLPLQTRDNNFAFRNKEVGRITKIKFSSKSASQIPVAVFYHLALKRDKEQDAGTLEAYTTPITVEARIFSTEATSIETSPRNSNSLEGLWRAEGETGTMLIGSNGKILNIGSDYFKHQYGTTTPMILSVNGEKLSALELNENFGSTLFMDNIGEVKLLEKNTLEITRFEGKKRLAPMRLKRITAWDEKPKQP
ncbi:MAG: hypothetical protein WCI72_01830 [archaeon]